MVNSPKKKMGFNPIWDVWSQFFLFFNDLFSNFRFLEIQDKMEHLVINQV